GDLPDELEGFIPHLTEDSFPGLLTNVISGRIANRLDLGGANYTVDAACASSLTALDAACKELIAGGSDMVLCGGADLHNGINDYLLFSSVHALSPTGQCRTFSDDADGIALGEGIACVVLKRLDDARRDGDTIHAVIKGVAASSDGRHLGLTAPRKDGQVRCLERAYARSGVDPAEVGLIEAHGTGTVVGDRTELATLTEMFGAAGATAGSTVLGSVKSQIGHTKCAAGLAGLIRVARAVSTGVRPPTGNITAPNDYWERETSPFRLDNVATPWLDERRTAGVSGFGFGGTNFHAVIQSDDEAPEPSHGLTAWPAEVFLFTGATWEAARVVVEQLADHLDHHGPVAAPLRNLAATVWARRSGDPRVCVIARDRADLRAKLTTVLESASTEPGHRPAVPGIHWPDPSTEDGRVAFLYPGQGSQRPRMLDELYVAFPRLRQVLRDGQRWADLLFPPTAYDAEGRAAQLAAVTDTRVAQPTLGIAGITLTRLLASLGVNPDLAAGHSYGELVALWAAGALPTDGFLELSEARGEAILAAAVSADDDDGSGGLPGSAGSMAALAMGASPAEALIDRLGLSCSTLGDRGVVVANHNAPNQSVVSGPTEAVEAVVEAATEAGERATLLNVACAFHSPLVADAADTFGARLAEVDLTAPRFDVYSNVTARPYAGVDDVARLLAAQVAEPVRFTDEIEAMYAAGARVFVEAGPGRVLSRLVGLTLGDRPHRAINCDVGGESSLTNLLEAIGQLAMAGVPVALDALFDGRTTTVELAAKGAVPGWSVDGHLVRARDGSPVSGGLRPATEFVEAHPMGLPGNNSGGHAAGDHSGADPAMMEYLQGMRELVAAQRDVMMSYLGVEVAPGSPVIDASVAPGPASATTLPPSLTTADRNDPPTGSPSAADTRTPPSAAELEAMITSIVADRTGYPADMLDPELDLEADLSIDSIKRIEILGELAERANLPGADEGSLDESVVESLAMIKTIRGIATWIVEERDGADTPPPGASGPGEDHTDDRPIDLTDLPASGTEAPVPDEAWCLVPQPVPLEAEAAAASVDGLTVWIMTGPTAGPVAEHLADEVTGAGGTPEVFTRDAVVPDGTPHVLIDTSGLDAATEAAGDAPAAGGDSNASDSSRQGAVGSYPAVRAALMRGARHVVLATGDGGRFALTSEHGSVAGDSDEARAVPIGGFRGLARAAAREYPDVGVRSVDLDPSEDPAELAAHLLAEIGPPDADDAVIGVSAGSRVGLRWSKVGAGGGSAAESATPIGPDRAVLLTGGARGITAKVAVGLARRFRCPLVLAGRSPEPTGAPSPELADDPDDRELRRRLIDGGLTNPRDIERRLAQLNAEAEVRSTLATLAELGVPVRYLQLDVTDPHAVEAALATAAEDLAPVGLIVHGAGVLADHLIADKPPEEFDRVWRTKVDGALALLRHAPADAAMIAFASISGAVGNAGQADYGAANDALDLLAHSTGGRRVCAIDWGPWAGGGMVSPELERTYERRGVGLVPAEDGVQLVCRLVADGLPYRQVMYVRAEPAALGALEADSPRTAPSNTTTGDRT
ncbi:MAG: SDR family NAD(P)-dependent oxidoreductase, partial [Microthrixaceae bacterium]